jgi:hypothetical protein
VAEALPAGDPTALAAAHGNGRAAAPDDGRSPQRRAGDAADLEGVGRG